MASPRERLIEARERVGKSHKEVAVIAGLNLPSYYDLETYDSELFCGVSLRELRKICDLLRIRFTDLFADPSASTPTKSRTFVSLADDLRGHMIEHNQSLSEFEDKAGWELAGFLENPDTAWDWSIDQLRDVCHELVVDWLQFLNAFE